jgi:hypothetical protein
VALLVLPITSDSHDQTFTTELEGKVYTFRFKYNARAERWTMDIGDENGNVIVGGVAIVADFPLIQRFGRSALPPGELVALNLFRTGIEPSEFSFDGNFNLMYEERNA